MSRKSETSEKTDTSIEGLVSRVELMSAVVPKANLLDSSTATKSITPSTSNSICSVNDYQKCAKLTLSTAVYEYVASGTDEEQTLAENRSAWEGWYLRPRMMRPVGKLSTATRIAFGRGRSTTVMEMSMPLFISPAGLHALCDPSGRGECASACE